MFEDSMMESSGKLKTKTGRWMILTGLFNLAIIATLILIPLLYPEALPATAMTAMSQAMPAESGYFRSRILEFYWINA